MNIPFGTCVVVSLALAASASALQVGDSYDQVIAEKGKPSGKMQVGATLILRYPDHTVKLKANRVVSLEGPPPEAMVVRTPVVAPGTGWITDYNSALAQAKEQNRKVFMFFTGSDWCVWCHRLQDEILKQPAFRDYARDNLVLLEVDFPHNIPQSDSLRLRNRQLAKKFNIEGYPTVIVLDGEGRNVGQLGYQQGGPGPFLDRLKSL